MIVSAFVLGIVGSLHCLGMCGPLVLAASTRHRSAWVSALLYHSGRGLSYAVLGGLAGTLGHLLFRGPWQSMVGWISGITMVGWGLWLFWHKAGLLHVPPFWRNMAGRLLRSESAMALLGLGMVNGLIPCGLLWAALAGAALQESGWHGSLFMVVFALGTWPALFGLTAIKDMLQPLLKHRQRWVAVWIIGTGFWVMYRSYRLDSGAKKDIPECHTSVFSDFSSGMLKG
jgi:sulfite exporter TauE/SafE